MHPAVTGLTQAIITSAIVFDTFHSNIEQNDDFVVYIVWREGCGIEEQELIDQTKNGDRTAFDCLQTSLEVHVRRFIWRLLGRTPLEDEIVQDAFLALYIHIRNANPIRSVRPFLYRIVRNLCYDELRKRKRHPVVSLDANSIHQNISLRYGDGHLPEETLLLNSLYREVSRAMAELPELQRQTLILFYMEELSYTEIAEVMGTDIGTVKSRLHYGKRALRKLVDK